MKRSSKRRNGFCASRSRGLCVAIVLVFVLFLALLGCPLWLDVCLFSECRTLSNLSDSDLPTPLPLPKPTQRDAAMKSSSPFCLLAFAAFFLAVSHAFMTNAPPRLSSSLCQSRQPARTVISMADGEGETKPKGKGWVRAVE